jgi:CHAT domain-containing protein
MADTKSPATDMPAAPLRLTVVNGDLSYAHYPVIVGHFAGDSISGPEARLDTALDGALSRRYALGIYPASVGSVTYAAQPVDRRPGGVVVGLGNIADFSAGTIRSALIAGLIELALGEGQIARVRDTIGRLDGGANPTPRNGAAMVMIGTRTGVVSMTDTLAAMLGAIVEAQRRLVEQKLRPFTKIQIFAYMEDTAHTIWHTLDRLIATPQFRGAFAIDAEVAYRDGAARRIARDENLDAWRALQIQESRLADGSTGLRFASIGGSARAEGMLVAGNREFVDKFAQTIYNSRESATAWKAAARSLYQLIWPPQLKAARFDNRNLRLILDTAAASLPFELMDDRQDNEAEIDGNRPPAVRYGILRQLVQQDFARRQTVASGERTALVIGDPHDGDWHFGFERLPGAQAEAKQVADQLERAGFTVTRLIGANNPPERVIEHVLRGGWTVLHVSAHGIFDFTFKREADQEDAGTIAPGSAQRYTGVLLGDHIVISPAILQAMPDPPTFAFINCCELAAISPRQEERLRGSGRPEFAASFAAQIIAMGARAVIAAGWTVDDLGGKLFGSEIYNGLLANSAGFGEVVLNARTAVYEANPDDSTWGAYQCYGEPDWRLSPRNGDEPAAAASLPGNARLAFASAAEAIAFIDTIREQIEVGSGRSGNRDALLKSLTTLHIRFDKRGWLARPQVAEALGRAFAALNEPATAITLFERALHEDALPSVQLIEQLATLRLRAAVAPLAGGGFVPDAFDRIAAVRADVEALCKIAGPTVERLTLIGATYKREALLQTGGAVDDRLATMRDCYRAAWDLAHSRANANAYYPGQLVVEAGLLIDLRAGHAVTDATKADLAGLAVDLASSEEQLDDYWHAASRAGYLLFEQLAAGTLSQAAHDAIVHCYDKVMLRCGSNFEFETTLSDMRYMRTQLGSGNGAAAAAWIASIEDAIARLEA